MGSIAQKKCPTEVLYLVGLTLLALATAMMERADLGMSMVVAPAYLVYRVLSSTLPFFTFGMAEYLLQGLLLVGMMLVLRRFRLSYLFSFVTAVLYGLLLDGGVWLVAFLPETLAVQWWMRLLLYGLGMGICALSVALLFRTYLSPEVYELLVKEIAGKYCKKVERVKLVYDCTSCVVALGMSFAWFGFGQFVGVKVGTIVCALVNGPMIGAWGRWLDHRFTYPDAFPALHQKFFGI